MKKIVKNIIAVIIIVSSIVSCETTELDLNVDPNSPPVQLDPDFFLNQIQFDFSEFFENVTSAGAETVRLEYMFNQYEFRFINTNTDLTNAWTIAYADILKDIDTILPVYEEEQLLIHSGIAKSLRAYTVMTLVDYFGDVPFNDALNGDSGTIFPIANDSREVYENALIDINGALADFASVTSDTDAPAQDLFYGGNPSQWIKFTNTLKLKYFLNLRLVDEATAASEIQSLISENNLIDTSSDNFYWRASNVELPQSRNQYYVNEYLAATTGDYISNYLMWSLAVEKGLEDPRLRYYVYRQTDEFPTSVADLNNEIDCWNNPRPGSYTPIDSENANRSLPPLPFCALFGRGDGYWGRDHANREGIPPDNALRSTYGVYPVGGRFDDNSATRIGANDGLDGAGIWPIMSDSFTYFMRAEASLYLGTGENTRELLETAIRKSINNVQELGGSYMADLAAEIAIPDDPNTPADETRTKGELFVPDQNDINDYVDYVLDRYDNAASIDLRMAIVGKEYWISLFGNGVEAYNLYKRTGTPINLQPTLLGTGNFPRTFLYPAVSADRNINISNENRSLTDKTFWDTNPLEIQ